MTSLTRPPSAHTRIVEGGNDLLVYKPGSIVSCPSAFCNREECEPKDGLGIGQPVLYWALYFNGVFENLFYIYKSRLLQIGDFCTLNKPHF